MITTRARCRIVLRSLQSCWDARDAAVEFHDFTPRAGMRGHKPHLYGGPHAGRLNVVCKTNEIKPRDYVKLSGALLISFNCWCFSACHSMIDILTGHRLLIRKVKITNGISMVYLWLCWDFSDFFPEVKTTVISLKSLEFPKCSEMCLCSPHSLYSLYISLYDSNCLLICVYL